MTGGHLGFARLVRLLVWLKWTLLRRALLRSRQRSIGAAIIILGLLPLALLMSAGSYLLARGLPAEPRGEFLKLLTGIVFAVWSVAPVFLYSLNESLDVRRLFFYPIPSIRLMIGLLITGVVDLSAPFVLGLALAMGAVFTSSPAAFPIVVLAFILFYAQLVAAGQAILSVLDNLLRDRRTSDATVVMLALIGGAFLLWQQFLFSQVRRLTDDLSPVIGFQAPSWFRYTPPGAATEAIIAAASSPLNAVAWLGLAAVWLCVLVVVWHLALRRLMTAAGLGTAPRTRPASAPSTPLRNRLPLPLLAIAAKDLRYLWRDPQLKALQVNVVVAVTIATFMPFSGNLGPSSILPREMLVLALPVPCLILTLSLAFNSLGLEREGIINLALAPLSARNLLLGKNLAIAVIALTVSLVLGIVVAALSNGWKFMALAQTASLAAILVALGAGNLSSVFLPSRVPDGKRTAHTPESGCIHALLNVMAFLVCWVLAAPIALALLAPSALGYADLSLAAVALSLVYAFAVFWVGLALAGPRLQERLPEILSLLTRE